MNFQKLQISDNLLKALIEVGYSEPTPIQEQAIPLVLSGRDVLGCAQTGTGKTAAFAVPILQRLDAPREKQTPKRPIRALVLTPTRELALQIYENFVEYGKYTRSISAVIFGGVAQGPQADQLRHGVDVLIATPGRLWDLIGQKLINLSSIEYFVLDEADRMLDMGFFPDVKRIIHMLPQKRQTLLFSATMPPEIASLANSLLDHPAQVAVTPAATTVDSIRQYVYMVDRCNKRALLASVIKEKGIQQTLVFTRTKHGADRVARDLCRLGIQADSIHGDKSQGARQRALSSFKENAISVLVATDIAARGIDISGLPYVINFDLPEIPETYVHRIGRTGRAGLDGTAISFCDGAQTSYLIDIEELTGHRIEEVENHVFPMTGEQPTPLDRKPQHHREGEHRPRKDTPRAEAKKKPLTTQFMQRQSQPARILPTESSVTPSAIAGVAAEHAPAARTTTHMPIARQTPSHTSVARPSIAARQNQTSAQTASPSVQGGTAEQKPRVATGRRDGGRNGRGGGRGGRRTIDNDNAQVGTKPLPARELSDDVRARIAKKVAQAHTSIAESAAPTTPTTPTTPQSHRRRSGHTND